MNQIEREQRQPTRHAAAFAARRLARVAIFAAIILLLLLYGGRLFAPAVETQVRSHWERVTGR
jgi:hypothetical protein